MTTVSDSRVPATAVDKLLITETLHGYALACDSHDSAGLLRGFTEDARAKYHDDPWLENPQSIVDWIALATTGVTYSQHAITPVQITVDGDTATAIGYLTSHQCYEDAPDEVVVMNSRYDWALRRVGDRWRISQLVLRVGWYEKRRAEQPRGGISAGEDGAG
jgi:ketosteroid isomerase-like protein